MRKPTGEARGFSLLELGVVIAIIAILGVLMVPAISKFRTRAQRMKCSANLRSLSVSTNLYIQEHKSWPQIKSARSTSQQQFAEAWIAALSPFGAERQTWICPTTQNLLQNPDYLITPTVRIDYIGTPFDDKPTTPHEWPRQPWFIERGDVHGNGNLIIFTDGSISDMKTVAAEVAKQQKK